MISSSEFRSILDDMGIPHHLDTETNRVFCPIPMKNINGRIYFVFTINEAAITCNTYPRGKKIGATLEEALDFCNRWNREKLFPKVYYDAREDSIVCEHSLFLDDAELSYDYIKDNFIGLMLSTVNQCYTQLAREGLFIDPDDDGFDEDDIDIDIDIDDDDDDDDV